MRSEAIPACSLSGETLLEQARANHAQASADHEQARANQASAEAALLTLRRNQGKWLGHDDELDAWFSDAHGVAEGATVLVRQGGIKEEPTSLVCTPPRAGVSKALHECEVYDIGEDGAQNCGGLGVLTLHQVHRGR